MSPGKAKRTPDEVDAFFQQVEDNVDIFDVVDLRAFVHGRDLVGAATGS